jgi:flagellar hook-length control protein FliK
MDGGRAQASSQQGSSQQTSNQQTSNQQTSNQQTSTQKPSLTQGTDSQATDALNAQTAASTAASAAATAAPRSATAVATSPLAAATAAPAASRVPTNSTETGSSSAASATAAAGRASASGVALGAEADDAIAAIRALEDAVLAARADRASSPSDAASRAADPALARVAAMEADLAAERVAQALGQGLVEFDGADLQARPAGNATALEKRPAAIQANGADARMMADAMAADRGGSTNTSAASAGIALPPAMAQASISSGLTALGASGSAADLARQPSDGATPGAQLAAKGLGILANQRGGAITMRLEPPALGQLRIELQVSQGAVVADFTAATAEARALLEANLGMLRERLESQGLSVERITIHGARTAEAATQSSADQRQDQGGNADARDRGGERRQDAAGGESRGRRDRDPGTQHEHTGRADRRQGGFASALDSASMKPAARRSA